MPGSRIGVLPLKSEVATAVSIFSSHEFYTISTALLPVPLSVTLSEPSCRSIITFECPPSKGLSGLNPMTVLLFYTNMLNWHSFGDD